MRWPPEFLLEGGTGLVHVVQAQYPQGLQLDVAGEIAQQRRFGMGKVMVSTLWGSHGGDLRLNTAPQTHMSIG